jgi:Swt1-like HEPN
LIERITTLRDWLFRGLLFEADAEKLRQAGIRVGADQRAVEARLLEEAMAPFALEIRNEALQMARIYALMYCFENAVRQLVKERLQEKYKADWWTQGVPQKVKAFAEGRQQTAQQDSWLEGDKADLLAFVEFGHLADMITNSWEDFSDLVPSQHWLKQRMEELEKARNFIAHNRLLLPAEFDRIEMYVADWNRMVGL